MFTPPRNTQTQAARSSRIVWLDLLKFFTSFLVVWGHTLLCCRVNEDAAWTGNATLRYIYSFHMPLFMMLTGMIYAMTLKSGFLTTAQKKFRQLMLPAITLGLIIAAINITFDINASYGSEPDFLKTFWNQLWFLKSAFVCCLVAYPFFAYKGRHATLYIVLAALASQFIPETPVLHYVYMLPFFLAGGLVSWYSDIFNRHSLTIAVASGLVFLATLMFLSGEVYIKCTLTYHWDQIVRFPTLYLYRAYRILTGLSGSVFFIALFICLFDSKQPRKVACLLAVWGQMTLGIYAFHFIALRKYAHLLPFAGEADTPAFTFFYTPLLSILLLAASIALTKLSKSNRWTAWLLMGSPSPLHKTPHNSI